LNTFPFQRKIRLTVIGPTRLPHGYHRKHSPECYYIVARIYCNHEEGILRVPHDRRVIQGSFANCNISLGLDLFNEGITEYI